MIYGLTRGTPAGRGRTWKVDLRLLASELEARVVERTREVEAERARPTRSSSRFRPGRRSSRPTAGRDGNAAARRLLGDDVASAIEGILTLRASSRTKRAWRWFGATAGMWCSRSVLRRSAMPMWEAGGAVYLFHDVSQREQQERAEREFAMSPHISSRAL